MEENPKRRWFRFSLRTLFVVVTIFGVWLGWQVRIVHERKAILQHAAEGAHLLQPYHRAMEAGEDSNYAQVSHLRKLLGDEPCLELELPPSFDAAWIERTEHAFPEAKLLMHISEKDGYAFRDSLFKPSDARKPNRGSLFKTGLIEK